VPKHRSWCRTRKSCSMGYHKGERSPPLADGGAGYGNGGKRNFPQAVRLPMARSASQTRVRRIAHACPKGRLRALEANRRSATDERLARSDSLADRQKQARCLISADIKPGMQRGRHLSPLAKVRGGTTHTL
jgi:hypothetical protein